MNTPAPLTDEEIEPCIEKVWGSYAEFDEVRLFVRAIESARDAQWQKMLGDGKAVAWRYHTVSAFPDKDGMLKVSDKWTLIPSPNQRDAHSATCGMQANPLFTHPAPDHTALLRQALEALENSIDAVRNEYVTDWRHGYPTREAQLAGMKEMLDQHEAAITAIKESLNVQSK